MIDLIKKSLLASAGAAAITKEKVEQALEEFVRQGKVSAADARVMTDKITEQGRKEFDEMCAKLGAKLGEFTTKAGESSHAKITALEQRLRVLEEKLTAPPTRAGEP